MTTQNFNAFANFEPLEAAYKSGQEAFDQAYRAGKENALKIYETGADTAAKNWAQWLDSAKGGLAKSFPQASDAFNQAAEIGRANLDALFSAGAIAVKGAEALSDELISYGRNSVKAGFDTAQKAAKCKTAKDLVELQTRAAREAFEAFTAEGQKVGELTAKTAGEAAEPIKSRFEQTFEKAATKSAA